MLSRSHIVIAYHNYIVIAYHNYIVIVYHNYIVIVYHFSKTFCGAITATILSLQRALYTSFDPNIYGAACCPQYATALQQNRQLHRMVTL